MIKSFSVTDIGRKRKLNQDFVYSSDEAVGNLKNVYIVADGWEVIRRVIMLPSVQWKPWYGRSKAVLNRAPSVF